MSGMARVGLSKPLGWSSFEVSFFGRTLLTGGSPGCHVVGVVSGMTEMVQGELFESAVPGV
jgi:hypothetical protein